MVAHALPRGVIVPTMVPIAFALAAAAGRWIEQPSIAPGRRPARGPRS